MIATTISHGNIVSIEELHISFSSEQQLIIVPAEETVVISKSQQCFFTSIAGLSPPNL